MLLKALILSAAISPAMAGNSAGVFQLEPESSQKAPIAKQEHIDSLKERAGGLLRKAATYVNTHPVLGNPDLPDEHRDILPHEAFGKLRDSFKALMREKLRERELSNSERSF